MSARSGFKNRLHLRLAFYALLQLTGYDCAAMQNLTSLFRIYRKNAN
jgi:hypothetical protein